MNYLNSNEDEAVSKKRYFLSVLPPSIYSFLITSAAAYFAAGNNYLSKKDTAYVYLVPFIIAALVYATAANKWLKMPDGTYRHIKKNRKAVEPAEYEAIFFRSKKSLLLVFLVGAFFSGFAIAYVIIENNSVLIPAGSILVGLLFLFLSVKILFDPTPELKLAKQGLWTQKTGFVDWKDLINAQVVKEKNNHTTQLVLEIYIKGSIYADAGKPDERLILNGIINNQIIKMFIEDLMYKRIEQG